MLEVIRLIIIRLFLLLLGPVSLLLFKLL